MLLLNLRDNMTVLMDTVTSCIEANVDESLGTIEADLLAVMIQLIRAEQRTLPDVLALGRVYLTKDILQDISA